MTRGVAELQALVANLGRARVTVDRAPTSPADEQVYRARGAAESVAATRDGPVFVTTDRAAVFEGTPAGWREGGSARSLRYANGRELWGSHGWLGLHEPDEGRLYRWNEATARFDEWDVAQQVVPLALINDPGGTAVVLPARGSRLFTAIVEAGRLRLDPLGTDFGDGSPFPSCGAQMGGALIIGGLTRPTGEAYLWLSVDQGQSWERHSVPSRPSAAMCSDGLCLVVLDDGSLLSWSVGSRSLQPLGSVAPPDAAWSRLRVSRIAWVLGARPRIVLAGARDGQVASVDIGADAVRVHEGLGSGVFRDGAGRLWLTGPGLYEVKDDGSLRQRWPSDRNIEG